MLYISLVTEPFADTFASGTGKRATGAGTPRARRPLRGLEIRDDTYAYLKLLRSDGRAVNLVDSGSSSGESTQTSNFILQSVSEQRMEKHQIVDTFGASYIYFFGEAPRFIDVSAVLVDSLDFNWKAEWWENYDKYLRGTKSVELGARTYLFYEDNVVEGYILNASAIKTAEGPLMAQLSFRMFVTNYTNVSFIGDPNYPVRGDVDLPADVDLSSPSGLGRSGSFGAGASFGASAGVGASLSASLQAGVSANAGFDVSLSAAANIFAGVSKTFSTGISQSLSITKSFGISKSFSTGFSNSFSASAGVSADIGLSVSFGAGQAQAFENSLETSGRTKPLRGLFSDNEDEFTASPALEETDGEGEDGGDFPSTGDGDLTGTAADNLDPHGADIAKPGILQRLGLSPTFSASASASFSSTGPGGTSSYSASAFATASYGPNGASASAGASVSGINNGMGFSGSSFASVSRDNAGVTTAYASSSFGSGASRNISPAVAALGLYGPSFPSPASADNPSNPFVDNSFAPNAYGNGVVLRNGLSLGVGIGGGIPNGTRAFQPFTGGAFFGARASYGFSAGRSGAGASIGVNGLPSAFSTIAMPGTLQPNPPGSFGGTYQKTWFLGPDGVQSKTNATGIFA